MNIIDIRNLTSTEHSDTRINFKDDEYVLWNKNNNWISMYDNEGNESRFYISDIENIIKALELAQKMYSDHTA